MKDRIFTTFEVGKILGVNQLTVARWVDSGKIRGHLTVGGHRRIRESDLLEYFTSNNMPVPPALEGLRQVRVLIIDDDESLLEVIAQALDRAYEDIRIETAADGFLAGQIMERFKPDIVILDIFLPWIDGFQVCRLIKQSYSDIRVTAITGHGSEEVRRNIMEAGADDYLEKPFDIDDLIHIVSGHNSSCNVSGPA